MRSGSLDSGRASAVMYRYRNGGNRSGGRSMTFFQQSCRVVSAASCGHDEG
jgi:hypothetical protein